MGEKVVRTASCPVLTIRSEAFNCEFEDYGVDLAGVPVLELRIVRDITGADAVASIEQSRTA